MKITEELIEERVDKYIEENKEAILLDIDNRISKAVDKSIRDYFNGNSWSKTDTQKYIEGEIGRIAVQKASEIQIDAEEIERIVKNKIMRQVKKISVKVGD